MKKTLIILSALLGINLCEVQAQGLRDILNKISEAKNENNDSTYKTKLSIFDGKTGNGLANLGDFLSGILGKDHVRPESLIGKWSYKQPAIVFASDNALTNVGVMAAGKAAEAKLQKSLDKIGFTEDKMQIEFHEDSTGTIFFAQKDIPFQWSIEGSEMTMQLGKGTLRKLTAELKKSSSKSRFNKHSAFTLNCKVNITTMQLSFKADKLMEFVTKLASSTGKAANNSTLSAIAGLADKVDEMYLGLTMKRAEK